MDVLANYLVTELAQVLEKRLLYAVQLNPLQLESFMARSFRAVNYIVDNHGFPEAESEQLSRRIGNLFSQYFFIAELVALLRNKNKSEAGRAYC